MTPLGPADRTTLRLDRRAILAAAAAATLPGAVWPRPEERPAWRRSVPAYLERLARPDGGYAWEDAPYAHLTPTFAAVGCHRLLGVDVPRKAKLAEFIRTRHPFHLKKLQRELRGFEHQQIQALLWLGEDVSAFRDVVLGWVKPTTYPRQYEREGNPVFRFELMAFTCRRLLGLPNTDLGPEFLEYLNKRRRPNGSFNGTPTAAGGDGHVMNTLWGLEALRALGRDKEEKEKTIAWLRACQVPSGGFTYRPKADVGGIDDVAYVRAAARALQLLGSEPADRDACVRYLHSLANPDGGFGDRPGWASNPVATYYALDALDALGALVAEPPRVRPAPARPAAVPAGLQAFTIQIEAHGQGSPAEAVDLARALRVHLWGAKNARPGWVARAQALADRAKVPVTFFTANEEYGTWVTVPGLGTYSHTSDVLAPPGADFGPSLAKAGAVAWDAFRERRLAPLREAGGTLVWQFGENEELVRVLLDDSLERGGFAAISTFHFGNPDFTNSEPFLYRYRGRIPFVALQDAHGPEPWWFADMTAGFRTVFLAREGTWAGWQDALRHNRVAAVRHDAVSRNETWVHAGSRAVRDAVLARAAQWRWWDNPDIRRPLVSVVVLRPEDEFEVGRPGEGVAVRVRCAWENTAQGLAKKPMARLVRLLVDGKEASPALVARKGPAGAAYQDYYHLLRLPRLAAGPHKVEAVVRAVGAGVESSRVVEFRVGE